MNRLIVACVLALAPACDAPEDVEADTDAVDADEIVCDQAPVLTYDTFGRGFLSAYCNGCHGGEVVDRKGAPDSIVFDDSETVSAYGDRIFARVIDPDPLPPMPPNGGVTPDDLTRLRIWLTCYP
jgi:hypothetical protein